MLFAKKVAELITNLTTNGLSKEKKKLMTRIEYIVRENKNKKQNPNLNIHLHKHQKKHLHNLFLKKIQNNHILVRAYLQIII